MTASFGAISHVLLDIEGTTCPVSFVGETLFPYARDHLAAFLEQNRHTADVKTLVEEVEREWQQDAHPEAITLRATVLAESAHGRPQRVVPYLQWLIAQDRKLTALKDLQGLIWEEGYAQGHLKAPLYDDVADALQQWRSQRLTLAVYSSGSVQAQQMLYANSSAGDLRSLFSDWFDTRIGPKQQASSYTSICQAMQAGDPSAVLFISDSPGELEAAQAAGLPVVQSNRPGDAVIAGRGFPAIESFREVRINGLSPTSSDQEQQTPGG